MGNFLPFFMVIFSLPYLVSQMKVYNKRSRRRCPPPLCVDNTSNNNNRCSCRPDCYLYNECCSNKINKTASNHKQPYPSISYSCRKVDDSYYYQFDRCPPNHDVTEHVNNCESPDSDDQLQSIPAFGKTSKKLYRNLYCALCHGEEFILWNLLYNCYFISNISFENITSYVEEGTCRPTVKLPSEDLEKYLYSCISYISDCPQDNINRKQRFKCESKPMALVTDQVNIFRNIHCATCNGLKRNKINSYCNHERKRKLKSRKFSLTMLFNYHTSSLVVKDNQLKEVSVVQLPSCPTHALYAMNTNQCQQVIYHPQLNCTTTTLNESEYYITNDGRLYLNNTQRLLNQSEFTRDSQGIISICVKNDTTLMAKYATAEYYITIVGLIISIPALAITIIVYLCIPDLRTLPGKLLISLLSALFVAELLFLISSQVTKFTVLCKSLAVVMHYSFLASFFWMNVISFDACHTFSGLTQLRSKGKHTKRFVLCSLYAWICPLVIVIVSLIFEYTPENHGLSPEYGKGICWIKNGKSLLWLFGIPVMIILCLNIIAFIFTTRGLYVTRKLSSKYLSKHNKNEFFIHLKLFFIMGLTWTIAFLYAFTRIEEFSLLFCIVNSFVGLFICVSFLSTKTVRLNILNNLHKIARLPTKEITDVSSAPQTISMALSTEGSVN
ncbi:probable G-protein coupled receptor Mth-like 12 isoform X2 [Octopus sinensis]|uniref:Probable G-protein coupled receptor Mth-like 12 isoform X2 n=1 Tax=Octopus sinensis TaxID=2607531 RepID=A0A7E6F4N3_9MOLL|nr:probable G-protein coupled receptor Mth-like 12 isoform X2 [Octopus sinensis]XP_036362741.1 probable G-protein coupled receptor Mth-like 12 isoform X2 [Octopus sinensis]XP_036362742.1 probable G-protein coupled receptor Mth-like 12 isoform X2 [Octopus sinensis]